MNVIEIHSKVHRLPGLGNIEYVYSRKKKELTINVGGVEISSFKNADALLIYNLASDDELFKTYIQNATSAKNV